ncbi:hypothetical protein EBR66_05125 [bacterium]|nr:hypothetical protein [bacterium]
MGDETLRLEGFSESLRNVKTYYVSSHLHPTFTQNFIKGRLALLDTEVAHRGRKVFICQGVTPPRWIFQLGWDAVFHARDVIDLKLAITYVQHAARPTRVVWFGGEPPVAVMNTLLRMDGLSLIAVGEKPPIQTDWQLIAWSPETTQDRVESTITTRMGSVGLTGLRSVLKELQSSQVGLVWSSIGEKDKRGSLYWYDPVDGVDTSVQIDTEEAAHVLKEVAAYLTR